MAPVIPEDPEIACPNRRCSLGRKATRRIGLPARSAPCRMSIPTNRNRYKRDNQEDPAHPPSVTPTWYSGMTPEQGMTRDAQLWAITSTTVSRASATPLIVNTETVRKLRGAWPPVRNACCNWRWRCAPTIASATARAA